MPVKTTEFSFPTSSSGTTLAVSTTFMAPAQVFYTEELAGGDTLTFVSARIEIYAHQQFGGAGGADMTSYEIGFGWGAAGTGDYNIETTAVSLTGLKQGTMMFSRDLTAWFTNAYNTSFLFGANQFRYTFRHLGSDTSFVNLCAKVIVTYKFTEVNGFPALRSNVARIPLDSNLDGFPLNVGLTTKAIGSNQLPDLNTFLPEGGKNIISVWVELEGNDQSNNTTNYQLTGKVGTSVPSEQQFASINKSLNTANWIKLHYHISPSLAVGTLNIVGTCSSGTKTVLTHLSAVLHVFYTYTPSLTSKMLVSVTAMTGVKSGLFRQNINDDIVFNIQETNPVLRQSGAVATWHCATNSTKPFRSRVGSQSFYAWTAVAAASVTISGQEQCSWRFDSGAANGAGISIARGQLVVPIEFYQTGQSTANDTFNRPDMISFRVYLNYECDAPSYDDFVGSGNYRTEQINRSLFRELNSTNVLSQYTETTLTFVDEIEPRFYTNIAMEWRAISVGEFSMIKMSVARMPTDTGGQNFLDGGVSWAQWAAISFTSKSVEIAICSFRQSIHKFFRRFLGAPDYQGMDWQYTDRRYLVETMKEITPMSDAGVWDTSTGIYYPGSGVVVNAGENLTGQIVDVFDQNDRHLMEVTCFSNGTFTYYHYDDTIQYYAVARRSQKAGASLLT